MAGEGNSDRTKTTANGCLRARGTQLRRGHPGPLGTPLPGLGARNWMERLELSDFKEQACFHD